MPVLVCRVTMVVVAHQLEHRTYVHVNKGIQVLNVQDIQMSIHVDHHHAEMGEFVQLLVIHFNVNVLQVIKDQHAKHHHPIVIHIHVLMADSV